MLLQLQTIKKQTEFRVDVDEKRVSKDTKLDAAKVSAAIVCYL